MITAICGSGKTSKLVELANQFAESGENVLLITKNPEKFKEKLRDNVCICLMEDIALDKIVDGASIVMIDDKDTDLKEGLDSLDYLRAIGKQVYYTTPSGIIGYDDMEINDEVIYVNKNQ